MAARVAGLADAGPAGVGCDGAAVQRLIILLELALHLRLVRQVLAIGDGKHQHADAREDVAVIVGQRCG